jgi:hypothetical protein
MDCNSRTTILTEFSMGERKAKVHGFSGVVSRLLASAISRAGAAECTKTTDISKIDRISPGAYTSISGRASPKEQSSWNDLSS